jgi:hypothetical protein
VPYNQIVEKFMRRTKSLAQLVKAMSGPCQQLEQLQAVAN